MNLQRRQQGLFTTLTVFVFLCVQVVSAKEPLRIGWVHSMGNAPVIIAEKKGYFKKKIKVYFSNQKKGTTLKIKGYVESLD